MPRMQRLPTLSNTRSFESRSNCLPPMVNEIAGSLPVQDITYKDPNLWAPIMDIKACTSRSGPISRELPESTMAMLVEVMVIDSLSSTLSNFTVHQLSNSIGNQVN